MPRVSWPPKPTPKTVAAAAVALIPLSLLALTWLGWYVADYHSLPWVMDPPHLSYCGRSFQYPQAMTAKQIRRVWGIEASRLYPTHLGPPLLGLQILTSVAPDKRKGWGCNAGDLFINDGGSSYTDYAGVGGP